MRQRTSALLIVVLMTGSLLAAPTRDEGGQTPIQRVVHRLKQIVVTTFEDLLTIPKP